jgi:hypothetical protein
MLSNEFAFRYQAESTITKFFYDDGSNGKHELEKAAFAKFRNINQRLWLHTVLNDFSEFPVRIQSWLPSHQKVLLRAKWLVSSVLGKVTMDEIFFHCRVSTGSTIGVPYRNTSPEMKFKLPLTSTIRAARLMDEYLKYDGKLSTYLSDQAGSRALIGSRYKFVSGSRATTVEKTAEKRRMIAIEPTVNMYLQQGIMAVMYNRLAAVGLDVGLLPDEHKELACKASIDGASATIDFSSASDCVSYELVKWLLPRDWFWFLDITRSPTMSLNGEEVDLAMFSTMGNAVTFPLETLIFWALGVATQYTCRERGNSAIVERHWFNTVSVFGDDCIVATEVANPFMKVCERYGFMVNWEKSFLTGRFRESCGGDYLAGYDVRPFFLKGPVGIDRLALTAWLNIALNQIVKKYRSLYGDLTYLYDRHAFRWIFSQYEKYNLKIFVVPTSFPDDAGAKIGFDLKRFAFHYNVRPLLSPISRDVHGTYLFKSITWRYSDCNAIRGALRYALALKAQSRPQMFTPVEYRTRKKGRYIVSSKNTTCHWYVEV